jgi:hypothetical protein
MKERPDMTKLLIALATGLAAALSALPPAYAQQDQPAAPRSEQQGESVSPRQLQPAQIRQLQQALQDQGHYRGPVDGVWGAGAAAALRQFAARGRAESTVARPQPDRIDRETLRALGLDPAQFGLADAGLPQGPTGRRGSSTLPGAAPNAPPRTSPGAPPSRSR